jgi:ligand-binding sensor domain-containing protein
VRLTERTRRTNWPTHLIDLRTVAAHARYHLRRQRTLLVSLFILALVLALCGAWCIKRAARAQLARERAQFARAHLIPFEHRQLPASDRPELRVLQATRRTRAVARFHDSYFAATDGGLLELTQAGAALRHYTVLDGLPESDLTSLAAWGDKLFIGTRTQGLAAFDGARFESYRFTDRQPQAITALVADAGRLFVGTFAGGLIEFDGRQFRELLPGADDAHLRGINCLTLDGARLYVGTFADGLWLAEAGRWLHFTTDAGLPSNRVVAVAAQGARLLVATDFGLASAAGNELLSAQPPPQVFQTIATLPTLAGLAQFGGRTLLCTDDGHLFALVFDAAHTAQLKPLTAPDARAQATTLTDCQLRTLDDELWLLTSDGIRRTNVTGSDSTSAPALAPFTQPDAAHELASNTVAALALDDAGRLWVGSFRDGIDLLAPDGRRLAHLDTEAAREINALGFDPHARVMLAATAQGLVRFDAALHATRTNAADGLLSNAVTHVALLPAQAAAGQTSTASATHHAPATELVCATSRGLSFGAPGHWRGLTSVQGLPSNSLYAVLAHGRSLFVGTLGGLAQVEAGRVVRVFTDANSALTHNWVTALAATGERVFIGTYGGGVFELLPSGELHSFAAATGALVVNPNALWSDGARLYACTLDGVWVFDLHTQHWTHLRAELPAPTVLSVTGDGAYVYFGTTNGIARIATSYFAQT